MPKDEKLKPIIPAATLVLFRGQPGREAEHLFIERSGNVSFAAGALAFPGGRIEAADQAVADNPELVVGTALNAEDAAARVAAVRETIEETCVAVAIEPTPDFATIREWRAALAEGAGLGALLAAAGAHIDLDRLEPFTRWCPQLNVSRRYDTHFYLAVADADVAAEVDHGEALSYVWLTASAALASADAGQHKIIFPTRRNLERLAAHADFDAAVAHARGSKQATVTPWIEPIDGVDHLCIPDDAGYPVTSAPLKQALKGVM